MSSSIAPVLPITALVTPQNGTPSAPQYPDIFAFDCDYQSTHMLEDQSRFLPPPTRTQLNYPSERAKLPAPTLASLSSKVLAVMIIVAGCIVTVVACKKYRKCLEKTAAAKQRKKPFGLKTHSPKQAAMQSVVSGEAALPGNAGAGNADVPASVPNGVKAMRSPLPMPTRTLMHP